MINACFFPQLSLFKWTASVSLTSVQNKVCLLMKNSPRAAFCSRWLCKCEDDLLVSFPKLALCWKQECPSVNASLLLNLYERNGCLRSLAGVTWREILVIVSNYLSTSAVCQICSRNAQGHVLQCQNTTLALLHLIKNGSKHNRF